MSPQKVQELLNELLSCLQMPFIGPDACNELGKLVPNLNTDRDLDQMITAVSQVTDREADSYFREYEEFSSALDSDGLPF